MLLEEPALRGADDRATLPAVQHLVAIVALQAQADPLGDPERQRRDHEDGEPKHVRDVVDRQVQLDRDDVVARREEQDQIERHRHRAQTAADRSVARTVEQVVLPVVARHPFLEERVCTKDGEDHRQQENGSQKDVEAPGAAQRFELEEPW